MSNARNAAQAAVSPISFKNRIINGAMGINQRGAASLAGNSTVQYLIDRWFVFSQAGMALIQATNDTSLSKVNANHLYFGNTGSTAKTVFAVGDQNVVGQPIEGINFADSLWGTANAKPFTLSFRARATQATTICLAFRNFDGSRSYLQTVALTTGSQSYSVTVPGCPDGVWKSDNGTGVQVGFCSLGGTQYGTTSANANKWLAGNYTHTTDTTSNVLDTPSRYVSIADVQFETGQVATPFDPRPFSMELALCQRYYCKTFPQWQAPANNPAANNAGSLFTGAVTTPGEYVGTLWKFPVTMRAIPTLVTYNYTTGTAGQWHDAGGSAGDLPCSFAGTGDSGVYALLNGGSIYAAPNTGTAWYIHATANAEL